MTQADYIPVTGVSRDPASRRRARGEHEIKGACRMEQEWEPGGARPRGPLVTTSSKSDRAGLMQVGLIVS